MNGRHYAAETKATVMAALLSGQQGVNQAARSFGIPKQTVSRWKRAGRELVKNNPEIAELLQRESELTLKLLIAMAKACSDPGWISTQPAGDLAIFHGVLFDKTMKILKISRSMGH